MTKNTIVERLLGQGHITVFWVAILLNVRSETSFNKSIQQGTTATCRVSELWSDGNIDTKEAALLLSGNEGCDL